MKKKLIDRLLDKVHKFTELGIALSVEKDHHKLLENILNGAKTLTNADGGTLYTVKHEAYLKFQIVKSDTLGLHWGRGDDVTATFARSFPDIPLYRDDGSPNDNLVAVCSVIHDKTIKII